jgi:hypothetical protein
MALPCAGKQDVPRKTPPLAQPGQRQVLQEIARRGARAGEKNSAFAQQAGRGRSVLLGISLARENTSKIPRALDEEKANLWSQVLGACSKEAICGSYSQERK